MKAPTVAVAMVDGSTFVPRCGTTVDRMVGREARSQNEEAAIRLRFTTTLQGGREPTFNIQHSTLNFEN